MNGIFWLTVFTLIATTYVAALALALSEMSRTVVEARLRSAGRDRASEWLFNNLNEARLSVSLLRTVLRLLFFSLVLVDIVGMGEQARLTTSSLLISGGIAVACVWLFTVVFALALARYISAGLIVTALPAIRAMTFLCIPLNRASRLIDETVRRLAGANLLERESRIEEELLRSIEETHREGGLDERSAALLENVVEFSSTDVGEVMTPRTDIDGLQLTDDLAAIRKLIIDVGHSRIPVFEENLDHIVGVLYVKDLVPYLGEDAGSFQLRPILRQPIIVPESKPVRELLADFQRSEVHMAIVIDEYGGTAGIVTIEDVLEEIVGEIQDEHDPDDLETPSIETISETQAEVDGRYHLDDLNEQLGLELPEDAEFDTIAGFVLAQLGRVPKEGESFESHNARFTAVSVTPRHVKRVAVELMAVPAGDDRNGANGK